MGCSSDSDAASPPVIFDTPPRQLVLSVQCQSATFKGKKRRDPPLTRSQFVASILIPTQDATAARGTRKKRRLEDWEAKGGFNIWQCDKHGSF